MQIEKMYSCLYQLIYCCNTREKEAGQYDKENVTEHPGI